MIEVYICEDNDKQREMITNYVRNYIMIENLDMRVVISTSNPDDLLNTVEKQHERLYLLDIELGTKINGIQLANEIRKTDVDSKIVFVTTHAEMAMLTFEYQLEVLDFILKDNPDGLQQRIIQVLDLAIKRFHQSQQTDEEYLQIKVGERVRSFKIKDILFIESSVVPHKLIMHLKKSQVEYYGTIKNTEKLSNVFFKCHKSIVVNRDNIRSVNKHTHQIELIDGELLWCSISGARELAKSIHAK